MKLSMDTKTDKSLGTLDREIGNGYLRSWLHIYATN